MAGAPVAGAVFASLDFLVSGINQLGTIARENYKLAREFDSAMAELKQAVYYAETDLVKFEGVNESLSMELLEHLHCIEDYLAEQALPGEFLTRLKSDLDKNLAIDTRSIEIKRMDSLISRVKATHDRLKECAESRSDSMDLLPPTAMSSPLEKNLGKGFEKRIHRIQELLSSFNGTMIRISIVGARGLGKSCLAKAIYETATLQSGITPQVESTCLEAGTYDYKIWIDASVSKTVDAILNEIKEAQTVDGIKNNYEKVKSYLLDRRYLVIIDNLCSSEIKWKDLSRAFPDNNKDSRVIITTSIHTVARDWSSGMYYIYHMQCLCNADSKDLYWKKFCGCRLRPDGTLRKATQNELDRAKNIHDKCDGLPAALISAGNYGSKPKNPFLTSDLAEETCTELNNLVISHEPEFSDMRRKFAQSYQSLESHDERLCFLYFSTNPKGSRISRKAFARKIEAEGLVTSKSAISCLYKLINRSLICNIDNKCQMQGTMLQFAIYKATAKNLVTVVEEGEIRHNKPDQKSLGQMKPSCRRLAIHCTKETSTCPIPDGVERSSIRSLSIFKSHDAIVRIEQVNFKLFKVIRVLDLEGCHGFKGSNGLKSICTLKLLRFLNIKNTDVDNIPKDIENLKLLQTIDFRGTEVHELPLQVLKLPAIANIFGVFALPGIPENEKLAVTKFLKEDSQIHTLDGLRINTVSEFAAVIGNAKRLKKIKVIGDKFLRPSATVAPSRNRDIQSLMQAVSDKEKNAIAEFEKAAASLVNVINGRSKDLCSLSIQSSAMSNSFISYPVTDEGDSSLNYLRLDGIINSLPAYAFQKRKGLRKICLCNTTLTCAQIVDGLESMKWLEHLKLIELNAWDGVFHVQNGSFPWLRKLCFKGSVPYPQIQIEEGGMSMLSSIELYCQVNEKVVGGKASEADVATHGVEITGPQPLLKQEDANCDIRVEGLVHLTHLDEVMLHNSADDALVKAWAEAARTHGNLPCVIRQRGWDIPEL